MNYWGHMTLMMGRDKVWLKTGRRGIVDLCMCVLVMVWRTRRRTAYRWETKERERGE